MPSTTNKAAARRVCEALAQLCKNQYFPDLPIVEIRAILDAEEWQHTLRSDDAQKVREGANSGNRHLRVVRIDPIKSAAHNAHMLLTGAPLIDDLSKLADIRYLVLSWYQMPSGNYEVNAYLS